MLHVQRLCTNWEKSALHLGFCCSYRARTDCCTSTCSWRPTIRPPSLLHEWHGDRQKDKWSTEHVVVSAFLRQTANNYGTKYPRSRGARDDTPLRVLPSHFTKRKIFETYESVWKSVYGGLLAMAPTLTPSTTPVSYSLLTRKHTQDMPSLRIAATSSDFCDTCITPRDIVSWLGNGNKPAKVASKSFTAHMDDAREEFIIYKSVSAAAFGTRLCSFWPFVFNFAEKVLLPLSQKLWNNSRCCSSCCRIYVGLVSLNQYLRH